MGCGSSVGDILERDGHQYRCMAIVDRNPGNGRTYKYEAWHRYKQSSKTYTSGPSFYRYHKDFKNVTDLIIELLPLLIMSLAVKMVKVLFNEYSGKRYKTIIVR